MLLSILPVSKLEVDSPCGRYETLRVSFVQIVERLHVIVIELDDLDVVDNALLGYLECRNEVVSKVQAEKQTGSLMTDRFGKHNDIALD